MGKLDISLSRQQQIVIKTNHRNRIIVCILGHGTHYFRAGTLDEIESAARAILAMVVDYIYPYPEPVVPEPVAPELLEKLPRSIQVQLKNTINGAKKQHAIWEENQALVEYWDEYDPIELLFYLSDVAKLFDIRFGYLEN